MAVGGVQRAVLTFATIFIGACSLFPGRRASPSAPPPPLTAPRLAYVDQRTAGNGFMWPLRPPPPSRSIASGPTMLTAMVGATSLQSLWVSPSSQGMAPLFPWLPWPSPGGAQSPWAALSSMMSTPPPAFRPSLPRAGCGYVNVGGEAIPLDCLTSGYGNIPSAARSLLSGDLFRLSPAHAGRAELPAAIDHREDGTEGQVRSQGRVGACSAFSFAAAVDHALARRTGRPGHVSVMHLWARYHEPSMSLPFDRNRHKPLTDEQVWPYSARNQRYACAWAAKSRCHPSCGATNSCTCSLFDASFCGRPVDADELARADALPVARVTSATVIDQDKATLMTVLAKGQDIWMAMRVTPDAFGVDNLLKDHEGLSFVVPHFNPEDTTSAHAMVIAGYRVLPKGTYFLLHNSWGETWGEGGYAWVHEKTLLLNLYAAYLVDAEPWDPRGSKVPPRQPNPSQCGAWLLPDSITAQCVPPCPDGSPRHNAVCADPRDCPAGYVNLYGECVVAAPDVQGTDPSTGIRYACAAGGCGFVIPSGSYGCSLPWCTASCPSPRFRLISEPPGFACTE